MKYEFCIILNIMKMFKILKYTTITASTVGLTAWATKPTNKSIYSLPSEFEENFLFKAAVYELIHTYVKFDDYTFFKVATIPGYTDPIKVYGAFGVWFQIKNRE